MRLEIDRTDKWCRRRDLNPHELSSLPPQDSVSTNSTTSANVFVSAGLLRNIVNQIEVVANASGNRIETLRDVFWQ